MTTELLSPVRLNIGSGDLDLDGFTSIDRKRGTEAFPLEYEDDSVDEIRASHILEHFGHAESVQVLKEWVRVLRPGGRLKLAVPDFEWIARHQGNGVADPLLMAYAFGGQTDENDYHKSGYTDATLRAMMRHCGLVSIQRWESEATDCARLPVSLNLEGIKAQPVEVPRVCAIMSMPRLAHTANWWCCERVLAPRQIDLTHVTGAFWGPCLERGFLELIDRDHNPAELILTIDYDTVFDGATLDELFRLLLTHEDIDAIAPWQMKREESGPLVFLADEEGKGRPSVTVGEMEPEVVDVTSAHFGLTVIRASALRKMPHPWFMATPAADGWGDGRVDEDIGFWHNFKASGNRLCIASHLSVGHIEQMITWPSQHLKPMYQHITDYRKVGAPRGART